MENFAPEVGTTNTTGDVLVITVELRNETTGELEGYMQMRNDEYLGDEHTDRKEWDEACARNWRDYMRPMFRRLQPGELVPGTNTPGGDF